MASRPTDADRKAAASTLGLNWALNYQGSTIGGLHARDQIERVASLLAGERERAIGVFDALASGYALGQDVPVYRIHRAIEEAARLTTEQPRRSVPLSSFRASDLLDPEPIPPMEFHEPTRRSSLRGGSIPRRGHGASEGDPSL